MDFSSVLFCLTDRALSGAHRSAAKGEQNKEDSLVLSSPPQWTMTGCFLCAFFDQERREFEQKCVKEQGAMREQLQVHIQTIGILVSEKSELQTALSYTQQAARQKTGEAEELSNRLQATKQRVSELERTLSSVSAQQKQFDKHNKELEKERDNLRLEVYRLNVSEEGRQQSSELSEQLKLRVSENNAMRLDLDELRKRLEMTDDMLQQVGTHTRSLSLNHIHTPSFVLQLFNYLFLFLLMESVAQLQTERDRYAEQIQEEGQVWKDKTEQLLSQVRYATTPLAQPIEALRDNEQLSRMCSEQESRLSELERHAERGAEDAEDRRRMLEDVQSDKATISRALAQNRTLKDQLAELQNGFVKLTNENMELTTALQSEHHVKKELGRRMGQLQEDLHNVKEQLDLKSQEYQALLEQRDQVVAHLQQYSAGYTALASEREQLHRQYLQQSQLMDRLQHDETQGRVQLEMSHKQLEQYQERLEQLSRDNEQLKAEVTELLNSSALATLPRNRGDGVESQSLQESPQKSSIAIPEDFESREEMEEFVRGAVARVEAERDEVKSRLEEERRLAVYLTSYPSLLVSGSEGVPVEVHEALYVAMERLQQRFTSLMQEKADLKERVEELEHRCIQLSGETDTIGEYITLYQNQRAIMKQKHTEKEQYISMLAQDKEEMKAKLAELQDLVMRLVGERNEWYSRYTGALASAPDSTDPPHGGPSDQVQGLPSDSQALMRPQEDGTTRQIMQLLQEIQNPQGPRSVPFLGDNPCVPFFYRPDEQDEVKILVV
uniref:Golgin A2 n=1 Tax=Oncorhynchus mykiss TaxID=8022 RepID=A0A8C7SAD4_ONCMY